MKREGFLFASMADDFASSSPALSPKDLQVGVMLGEGSFARVHKASLVSTGEELALKIVDAAKLRRHKREDEVHTERRVLTMLAAAPHANCVLLRHTFSTDSAYYLALELLSGGELLSLSRPHGQRLSSLEHYLPQVLAGLRHLHGCTPTIVYRDLKPENCCLSATGVLKLVDFGSAKLVGSGSGGGASREFVGTPHYMSPEAVGSKQPTTIRSDYWSLGALLCQLLSGEPPFEAGSEFLTLRRVQTAKYQLPEATPSAWADLARRLLVLNPRRRLTAEAVQAHAALAAYSGAGAGEPPPGPPPPSPQELKIDECIAALSTATDGGVTLLSGLAAPLRARVAFEMGRRGVLRPELRTALDLPAEPPPPITDDLAAALPSSGAGLSAMWPSWACCKGPLRAAHI